jgi:hypothetical protein
MSYGRFNLENVIRVPSVKANMKIPEIEDFHQDAFITYKGCSPARKFKKGDRGKLDDRVPFGKIYAEIGFDLIKVMNQDTDFCQQILERLSTKGRQAVGLLYREAKKLEERERSIDFSVVPKRITPIKEPTSYYLHCLFDEALPTPSN